MPPDATAHALHHYDFRRLTRADFAMLREWLGHPHMGGWWADADTELALLAPELDAAPGQSATDMRIVAYHGSPFAYLQDYEVHAYDMPQFADLPQGTRGMDTFLGDPAYLGQGHAGRYLAQRARALIDAGARSSRSIPNRPTAAPSRPTRARASSRLRCATARMARRYR